MDQRGRNALDRHITGNYGENQYGSDDEAECVCGHFWFQHTGASIACTGTGATLDAMYQIPPDEACACETFKALI